MAYPTLAEAKAFILNTTGVAATLDDAVITLALEAFITALETDTGISFVPISETRRFDGNENHRLFVDPFISLTSLEVEQFDGTLIDIDLTHLVTPKFAQRPYTEIHFRQNHGASGYPIYLGTSPYYANFPSGNSNILVTASWGWGLLVPSDVQMAMFLYLLTLQNSLKPSAIAQLTAITVKEVEETDRRKAFQLIAPEKFLPRYLTWTSIIKRYSVGKGIKARRARRIMIQ